MIHQKKFRISWSGRVQSNGLDRIMGALILDIPSRARMKQQRFEMFYLILLQLVVITL